MCLEWKLLLACVCVRARSRACVWHLRLEELCVGQKVLEGPPVHLGSQWRFCGLLHCVCVLQGRSGTGFRAPQGCKLEVDIRDPCGGTSKPRPLSCARGEWVSL